MYVCMYLRVCVCVCVCVSFYRYCEDLVGQFETVVSKLAELHPSHSKDEARALLVGGTAHTWPRHACSIEVTGEQASTRPAANWTEYVHSCSACLAGSSVT